MNYYLGDIVMKLSLSRSIFLEEYVDVNSTPTLLTSTIFQLTVSIYLRVDFFSSKLTRYYYYHYFILFRLLRAQ